MKENLSQFENTKDDINIQDNSKFENEISAQTESAYLQMFCKDLTKINNRDECGWTPLYRTIVSGLSNATELLLKNGADPNIQSSMGETPLYQAVDMEKVSHVNLLLKNKANPNICQIDGFSPLHLAVNRQNILIIKELLKYDADPNAKTLLYEQTPLHFAIKNNVDPMILLILVQYNGSLYLKDKFGKKPLDYVSSDEMRNVIEKLKLENSEDSFEKRLRRYNTPNRELKWTESNILSDSLEFEYIDNKVNNNIIYNKGNIQLKRPNKNYLQFYIRRAGTIGNDSNSLRKHLFKGYNKKIINQSFCSYRKDNNNIVIKNKPLNKAIFNHIKKNISLQANKFKDKINTSTKKIPHNFGYKHDEYYSTLQNEEEKSILSQNSNYSKYQKHRRNSNIPTIPKSKYLVNKNNILFSDKDKSTCINSEFSTISKYGTNLKRNPSDFNTITEVKKFTLMSGDSRNNKMLSNYFAKKKLNYQSEKKRITTEI